MHYIEPFVFTGRSAVRLARLPWEQEAGGSNPLAPTIKMPALDSGSRPDEIGIVEIEARL